MDIENLKLQAAEAGRKASDAMRNRDYGMVNFQSEVVQKLKNCCNTWTQKRDVDAVYRDAYRQQSEGPMRLARL